MAVYLKKLINIFVFSQKFIHFFEVSIKLHSFLINLMYILIYNIVQVPSWLIMMEVTDDRNLSVPSSAGPSVPPRAGPVI